MKRGLLEIEQTLTGAAWQASKGERKGRKRERRLGEKERVFLKSWPLCFSLPPPPPSRFSFAPAKHLSRFSPSRQIKIEMPVTFIRKKNSRCGTFEITFYILLDEKYQTTEALTRGLTLNYSTFIINSNVPFLSSRFCNFYRAGV